MRENFRKLKRLSITGKLSLVYLFFLVNISLFPAFFSWHSPIVPSGSAFESPSLQHVMGTDDLGRDLWSQICYGTRISLFIGLTTAFLSTLIGAVLGILSGYYGGKADQFIMRTADFFMTVPQLPTMIVLGAFFGPNKRNIIGVLTLFQWVRIARVIRSKMINIKLNPYIKIAEGYGAKLFYLSWKHFLPQLAPLLSISFIQLVNRAIIAEASLSFLGLGDPTSKSWGIILNHATGFSGIFFMPFWKWWVVFPLLLMIFLILSLGTIARDLEKIFYGEHS